MNRADFLKIFGGAGAILGLASKKAGAEPRIKLPPAKKGATKNVAQAVCEGPVKDLGPCEVIFDKKDLSEYIVGKINVEIKADTSKIKAAIDAGTKPAYKMSDAEIWKWLKPLNWRERFKWIESEIEKEERASRDAGSQWVIAPRMKNVYLCMKGRYQNEINNGFRGPYDEYGRLYRNSLRQSPAARC